MYKWRTKSLPPEINSLESYANIVNMNNWKHLLNHQNGSLNVSSVVGTNLDTSVIFVDLNFANKVCENCNIFIDATFKVVLTVNDVQQLLVIKAEKFNHANLRNIFTLGLEQLIQESAEAHHCLKLILALPLLPNYEILNAHEEIKANLLPQTQIAMLPFLNYFERQWIRRVTPNTFSVFMLPKRTNNDCESYNKILKQLFGVHTNIWNFTTKLFYFPYIQFNFFYNE
ncbi:uncharacterized protein LOC122508888 [Leptopilina heterotoma]|uniref:uncharacterized protein LOC122508888 n=1 Tax=Leptopilina heterotoma TaxID=63436 RepID=UPI001CAA0B82|nr:uncharacterized protein LOC122508888 [Leptopilina heterotoma]XP_043478482.1 uncharacterized protein LOC122508888 [Leptopilina heterotoma]